MPSKKIRAYVSVSYSERNSLKHELEAITATLAEFNVEAFIFVDHYSFDRNQEHEMMQQAMSDIEACDFLIAEVTHKAIGIGIELGYGKAKSKPIVYLRKKGAEHSTTVSGISDFQITYQDVFELQSQVSIIINKILIGLSR